jgi:hypothetical protein
MAKNSNNSKLRQAALEAVRIQVAHRGQKEARLLNLLSGGSSTAQPTSGANKHLMSFSPSEEAAIAEGMRNPGKSQAEIIEELLDFGFL